MDPAGVQTPAGANSGGGELRPRDGGAVPPEGPLLHHLVHVRTQQAKHQRVDQHAHLGRLALSVGDHGADHGQHARQVVGHRVGNQEKEDEACNLGHLVLCTGKKIHSFFLLRKY